MMKIMVFQIQTQSGKRDSCGRDYNCAFYPKIVKKQEWSVKRSKLKA